MTITTTARLAGPYTGNGVSTAFAFEFKVFAQADVDVVFANAAGVETTLVLDSDYSVVLNGDQDTSPGGTVTYPISGSPMASPNKIAIIGGTDYSQTSALPTGGGYNAVVVERALDRLAVMAQQLLLTVTKTVRLPFTSDVSVSATLPSPTALGLLGWNAAANAIINYAGVAGVAVSSFMTTVVAAANGVAARTALGFSAIGESLAVAASAAAARTALGASTIGSTLFTTATAATARSALGSTTVGDALFIATDANTARAAILQLPPVRQTVLAGPVDANGLSSFGGATGSGTVTAAGTLVPTSANGVAGDRIGSIVNPSWTGLTTNGTMYLYLDIAADGTCTTGSTTLAPTYREGGADVVTNGQFTFNKSEMVGKVGNGSVATQTHRVFVGEVTVAGAVVTAITWYALRGVYVGAYTATLPNAAGLVTQSSNLGTEPEVFGVTIKCTTTDFSWAVGDIINYFGGGSYSGVSVAPGLGASRNSVHLVTGGASPFQSMTKTGSVSQSLTAASWSYRLMAKRGW